MLRIIHVYFILFLHIKFPLPTQVYELNKYKLNAAEYAREFAALGLFRRDLR